VRDSIEVAEIDRDLEGPSVAVLVSDWVGNRTSSRSNTTCASRVTRPDVSKALRQFFSANTFKKRVSEGGEKAFLVNVEDALACQVSDTLRVLALQRQKADHIKRLEDVR
jgi:hypothetical protein